MYCGADTAVTVRPMYPADGRKIPDIYAAPEAWRATLTRDLGPFPLFNFWGPMAGIASSAWIAEAALRVMAADDPTITLVYLPHLDYPLQKLGPNDPAIAAELRAVDACAAG
jgi:predicted AlkP superfamily pyrophosphatase or phosphodiesterase